MLALKTLAVRAEQRRSKTLIFDEVDAGIGGRVADVVGRGCASWAAVPGAVHHAPAADCRARRRRSSGSTRRVRGSRTVTSVERLDQAGRVEEIARMIGGASVTEPVRASARELLASGATDGRTASASGERRKRNRARKAKAKGRTAQAISAWRRNT